MIILLVKIFTQQNFRCFKTTLSHTRNKGNSNEKITASENLVKT